MANEKGDNFITALLFFALLFGVTKACEVLNGPSQLIRYKASNAYEGYTLFPSGGTKKTCLIDMLGNVVHTWERKTDPPAFHHKLHMVSCIS